VAQLIPALTERVAAAERRDDSHADSIDALAEAVTVFQNRPKVPKGKAPAKATE
jgi:hypothetical protein